MSKPALCATSTSAPANAARSSSCSLQVLAPSTSSARRPWMRVFSSKNRSWPGGGWMSHPAVATTRAVAHARESDRAGRGIAGVRRLEVDRGEVQGHASSVTADAVQSAAEARRRRWA